MAQSDSQPLAQPLKLGWYFNSHGAGHRHRLQAVLPHFSDRTQVTTLSSGDSGGFPAFRRTAARPVPHVQLPPFNQTVENPALRSQVWRKLHGMQLNQGKNAAFTAQLTQWIATELPDLIVSDVALEVALAARLCGVPVVYMRQHGKRWDLGHQIAYEASLELVAPFDAAMEEADCPRWIKDKTFYAGGFSRFVSGTVPEPPQRWQDSDRNGAEQPGERQIVVLVGAGGTNFNAADLAAAAQATPTWRWHILGRLEQKIAGPSNVVFQGFSQEVWAYLHHADLVIANAGHNTVMEIGQAGTPFLCFPAQRPFKEQLRKGEALQKLGLALVRHHWPSPGQWPALLEAATQLPRRWQPLLRSDAPRRVAQRLESHMDKICSSGLQSTSPSSAKTESQLSMGH